MTKSTSTEKPQPDKFRDVARQLECDEDEKAFEEKVRKVARPPVPNGVAGQKLREVWVIKTRSPLGDRYWYVGVDDESEARSRIPMIDAVIAGVKRIKNV